jgi:tartrate/fumarate subfamily iron-sulfur-dependent hydro-lyase beta chain
MKERKLSIPVTEEAIRDLNVGDLVYFDGPIFTGRSRFHIRAVDQNILPPIDFARHNVFVHMGPVVKKTEKDWIPIGLGPTSSLRFEKYGAAVIRNLKLRVIIGKTTAGEYTTKVMKEVGCIHVTPIGAASMGNILALRAKVNNVYFLDELGSTEATWVFQVKDWGPFMVDTDTRGNNFFEQKNIEIEKKLQKAYEQFGIAKDFRYTPV